MSKEKTRKNLHLFCRILKILKQFYLLRNEIYFAFITIFIKAFLKEKKSSLLFHSQINTT